MISIEWHVNETCENCGQNKPNCAEITLNFHPEGLEHQAILCSGCVEELKRRLS